jgi:hypothetical protein
MVKLYFSYALVVAGSCAGLCAEQQDTETSKPMSRSETVLVSVSAKVVTIDYTNREVTLKGSLGNEVSFTVDQRVKRLSEVKVGDSVRADYYVSVAAEVRKPTADEEAHPIVLLDAAGKAPPDTSPAAGGLRRFKVVTTIEGLDRPTKTITVKGPRGNYLTVRVLDPSRLAKVRIGETVVITYTEALAISLEVSTNKAPE